MTRPSILLPALLLGLLAACGGGSGSPTATSTSTTATRLAYTDPTSGTYLLKKNTTLSTDTHLVLDLWGPSGATGCGASVTLTLTGAATWTNVASSYAAGTYVANGDAFSLGSGTSILKAVVTDGTLVATVAQKGLDAPVSLNQALLRVALDLPSGTSKGAGITLTPHATKCLALLGDGTLSTLTVTAAAITAQ